jgi:NADH dehydrogenase/NADH:ubiquinone oxidoreductase subunit G
MGDVNITIDGARVTAKEGTTILQAAGQVGIEIPTICHQDDLRPAGNCRICAVELEGSRTLVSSCHTPIAEGMVLHTRSARVIKARRAIIELLIAGHTGPCVKDTAAKDCKLHKMAADLEVGPPRFPVKKPRFYPIEEISPYVRRDLSRCILCRNCIRACREIAGQNLFSMAYRGFHSKVVVDCDVPLDKEVCKDCGICIAYCPTTALLSPTMRKPKQVSNKKRAKGDAVPERGKRAGLLERLKTRQRESGHISKADVAQIAEALDVSVSEVYGVSSFYAFLSTKPQGKYVIRVCKSLPCYLKDAPMILETVERAIGVGPGETSADGRFSLELTNCIGACDRAPAMLIDYRAYGNLTPEKISKILHSYP